MVSYVFLLKLAWLFALPSVAKCSSCSSTSPKPACRNEWATTANPRTCVYYSHNRLDWHESKGLCEMLGAFMAVPSDNKTNALLGNVVQDKVNVTTPPVWLALTDYDGDGKWSWYNETEETTFDNWGPGQEEQDDAKHCAILNTNDLTWSKVTCSSKYRFICEIEVKSNGVCQYPYELLAPMNICIKAFEVEADVDDAIEDCELRRKGRLLAIREIDKLEILRFYMTSRDFVWIGLSKDKVEGKFKWTDGKDLHSSRYQWAAGEPRPGDNYNCVYMRRDGKWRSTSCNTKLSYFCQKPSGAGPTKPKLSLYYHREPNTLFLAQPLEATCSSRGTEVGKLFWKVVKDNMTTKVDISAAEISNTNKMIKTEDGQCIKETTSSFLFRSVTFDLNNAVVSCFAYESQDEQELACVDGDFTFCRRSLVLRVVDGPKSPPILNWNFYKSRDELLQSEAFIANCSIWTGKKNVLKWVVHFPTRTFVIDENDSRTKTTVTYDAQNRTRFKSELRFGVNRSIIGFHVACFAYDVLTYKSDLQCYETDRYCAKTPPMRSTTSKSRGRLIRGPKDFHRFRLVMFFSTLFMLLLLVVLLLPCWAVNDPVLAEEYYDYPKSP